MTNSILNSSFFFVIFLVFARKIIYYYIRWLIVVESGAKWLPKYEFPRLRVKALFIGEYNHSIDEKGRVRIPKNFRDELGETFYVTRGFDKCLFVFSEKEWTAFQNKLGENQLKSKDFRRIHRFFTGSATQCNLDGQGRATLSQAQRVHGDIEKDVVVMGVSNRIEIWSKSKYDAYVDGEFDNISDLADSMDGLDL